MTMLWLLFMVLILVSIGVVLLPFLRQADEPPQRADYDIVVYRSQLAEVDQEIERDLLTPDQADAARAEIHRRMLAAEDAEIAASAIKPRFSDRRFKSAAIIALAVILPLGSVGLYSVLGSPTFPGKPYAWRIAHDPEFLAASSAGKLAAMVQANPTAAGYKKLAQVYFDARDYPRAADADRQAVRLGARDAATWSELGESIVMASGGAVVPEALMAFTNSLATDAANPRSRFYIGLAESQIGNLQQAVAIWRDLESDSDPNASWRPLVEAHIAAVSKRGGFDPQSIPPQRPSAQALQVALNAMTNAIHTQADAPQPAAGNTQDAMIHAMVDRLAARMNANPNDKAGWERLAHAYTVLGESDKARAAAEHAASIRETGSAVVPR